MSCWERKPSSQIHRLKNKIAHNEEVSQRRELGVAFGVDRILDSVASHFKVSLEDVLEDKKEKRNISIYLIKK
ncbi:MAG: hypothetical protein ISS63_07060 [Desulfobacteraceae bacterium]|nr:hypothetical protein [Desulfobacteraceae bacterium]